MKTYSAQNDNMYNTPLVIMPSEHTMQNSLLPYVEMKIPNDLKDGSSSEIVIRGKFDRSNGGDSIEKGGKIFNYMRPTVEKVGDITYLNCFPGIDYVFHYRNLVNTYFAGTERKISTIYPSEKECWTALYKSSLMRIPIPHTVIMGYVEGLDNLSTDSIWRGTGTFLWKKCDRINNDAILLGCKHSYWGEISLRIAFILAARGCKRLIYVGKLGALIQDIPPNRFLATGCNSLMPDGSVLKWNNLFDASSSPLIIEGDHITLPSVLQETKVFAKSIKDNIAFVDSEIGYMAYAALRSNMAFSYLHVISDNLCTSYKHNLSNERNVEVLQNRQALFEEATAQIKKLIGGDNEKHHIS